MERIDLLWDAFEDCLCKEELRAEFDRLNKMALDEWERAEALQSWLDTIEKSRRAFIKILDETMLENEELQSWLDKICGELLRSKEWANHIPDNIPLPYPAYNALHYVYAYLDSQKPSEKPPTERHGGWISVGSELPSGKWGKSYPWLSEEVLIVNSCSIEIGYYNRQDGAWYVGEPAKEEWIDKITHWMPLPVNPHVCSPKCEHKNGGISYYSEGVLRQWCDDCKKWFVPKPLTQCPECIWGQKRREFMAVEGAYCKYVVYERCPRCRGGGRISC